MFRIGGDSWTAGSYDPGTNLIYWATAQAKPWARFQRGHSGDALYTNSVLALDPASGEIVWYNQLLPGETHDMDETFENLLVDHDGRRSLFKMGKLAILWELDRATGRFRAAHDLGYQTILDVHPETGAITYRPGMIPQEGVELEFCPSVAGFKSWRAMAYHPDTRAFYVPLLVSCERTTFGPGPELVEGGGGVGISRRMHLMHPQRPDGVGEFVAIDVDGNVLWRHRTRTAIDSAALTTGGGLVVVGDWDRNLYVHDGRSGEIVPDADCRAPCPGSPSPTRWTGGSTWRDPVPHPDAELRGAASGFPSCRATPAAAVPVDAGRQYLAIPVGSVATDRKAPSLWSGHHARRVADVDFLVDVDGGVVYCARANSSGNSAPSPPYRAGRRCGKPLRLVVSRNSWKPVSRCGRIRRRRRGRMSLPSHSRVRVQASAPVVALGIAEVRREAADAVEADVWPAAIVAGEMRSSRRSCPGGPAPGPRRAGRGSTGCRR